MSSLGVRRSAERPLDRIEQGVLQQQIVDRVGGKRQLRKHRQCDRLLMALPGDR